MTVGDFLRRPGVAKYQDVADALDTASTATTAAIAVETAARAAADALLRDRSSFRQSTDGVFTTALPYYTSDSFTALTTVTPSQDVIRAVPFIAPARGGTLDRLAIYCTVLGAASHARCGIYTSASDSNFYPTSLVFSTGDLDTSSTGLKQSTFSLALTGGKLYWLAHICDNGTATIRGVTGTVNSNILGLDPTAGTAYTAIFVAQAYGALPSTFPASASMAGASTVAVFVRFSA